ncbi:Uma2 family endonuclease [Rhodopirellula sp. JC639]|uniref:Uma2 family endonuclease n=1 Tax=Stieleria mannarensis TaxID=2755585 RepID=UPI0016041A08|nr:Uma2 family endonuclease [Rhodopirellula sp. JC639]
MSSAAKYLPRYTVDDYRQWEGDWELWQGIPVAMSPSPFGKHQMVLVNLVSELRQALRSIDCDATALCEIDWVIADDTVVRPDAVVVCGGPPSGHVKSTPAIVAEIVSPATADRDRIHKKTLYHESAVGIYLILDPDTETVEAFQSTATGFQSLDASHELTFSLCDDCELRVDPKAFFNR